MAKTFNQLFKEIKETVYSQEAMAIQVLASMNTAAEFTPNLAPNGAKGTTSSYTLQRRKRPSVNVVANPNSGSTSDALAALDQFSKVDWVSQEVVTGKLRSVGFKATFNDDYDFSDNPKHAKDMTYMMGETAVARKEDFITLFDTLTPTATALPAYVAKDTKVWDAIADEVLKLVQVNDEFKTKQGSGAFITYMSADVAKSVAKEMGVAFNDELPIAMTGFTSKHAINGSPVIVDATLAPGSVYIFHNEAFAFLSDLNKKDIKVDLGLTEFTGKFFYDVLALVDKARSVKFKKKTP